MYARSAAFDAAKKLSHTMITRADVLLGNVVVSSALNVDSGQVQIDGTAATRRRCSLNVIDEFGTLTQNVGVLSPYGRELRVSNGIQYPDGTQELITMGTFRISDVSSDVGGSNAGIVAVSGFDRSRSISRARFESPYTIASGTNYSTAIANLVQNRLPSCPLNFTSSTATTPLLVFDQGADPWASAQSMATAIGCELFFDPNGTCVLRGVTDLTSTVWDYTEGANASVITISNSLSDEPGYNGLVVDGEPPGLSPVHAVVYDTDPSSPTYSLGPYGKVPMFYKSQFITSLDQATAAATALLATRRGGTEALQFTAIPHPAHEVGDLVRVATARLGINANYVFESFSYPLGVGAMSVVTRKRRTA